VTAAPSQSIIRTSDLGHAYGDIVALHHVDLDIPAGTIGLVGANGAGKSTLIKILLGILAPTTGAIEVLGTRVTATTIAQRDRVGYMPEGDCLPIDQKASDFLVYAALLAGLPKTAARQRASDVLTLVGLDEERFRYFGEFSTGMKQRAKLAQAIVHDPQIVYLDEPTAGLDPEGREEMLDLIDRLGGFGINVLASSHVLSDIEKTCDWVIMLDGGRVLRNGPISGLSDSGVAEVEVTDHADRFEAALIATGASVDRDGHVFRVSGTADGIDAWDLIRDTVVAADTGIRKLGIRSTTLEDIFLGESDGEGTA
jgi:ABC-2 type transport system ATP-binding protein